MKLEKGIPIPPVGYKTKSLYPWQTMEVGESFAVPIEQANIRSLASTAGNRYNRRFVVRTLVEEGVIRIWRVE